MNHTPTPYKQIRHDQFERILITNESGQIHIAELLGMDTDEADQANAAFIVRACNNFDDLVNILKKFVKQEEINHELQSEGGHYEVYKEAKSLLQTL